MEMTEVKIILPLEEYGNTLDHINASLPVGVNIVLGSDTVIRTWVLNTFWEWFNDGGMEVLDHYHWAELPDLSIPLIGAGEVDADITVTFAFLPSQESEAMLFKLTFGGAA